MPSVFSKSLSQAAATRLRSANAIKAMLRDSLNIYAPKSEDDSHPTDMPQSTATPATPFISDEELLSLDFPRDGFEDVDLDDDEPPYRTRKRHDSAASIATIIPATRPAPSPPKDKKKIRRTSSAWRVSSSKDGRRSLKRSHSSRNLLLELGEDGDHIQVDSEQQVEDVEEDWLDEMPGLKLTTSTRADGVTTLNFSKASNTRALSLPTATASTAGADDLVHLSEFIAQEGYSARMLDSLYNTVVAGVRVRQRFDLSVNFKTKHIELWDVVNFKCVLSLLFTSEPAETNR